MPTIEFCATPNVVKTTGLPKKHLEQMVKIGFFAKALKDQGNIKDIQYDFSGEGITLTIELKCGIKQSVLITHEMIDAKKLAMEYYMRREVVRDSIPTLKFMADYSLCKLMVQITKLGLVKP